MLVSCDFPCVSGSEFGSVTIKHVDIYANPFGMLYVRDGVLIRSKKSCDAKIDPINTEAEPYNFWYKINERYNKNTNYEAKISGSVSFCAKQTSSTIELTKFSELLINHSSYSNSGDNVINWQDNIDSSTRDPWYPGSGVDAPVVHYNDGSDTAVNIFGFRGGIFFDGKDDYYNYDNYDSSGNLIAGSSNYANLLGADHLIFMMIDPSDLNDESYQGNGTIFASVDHADYTVNDRLYIEEGNLKFFSKALTNLADLGSISGTTLIIINRSGDNILIRVNGIEKLNLSKSVDYTGLATNSLNRVNIGAYLDLTGSIQGFYKGYIGYIDSYSEDYDISDIDNLKKLLDIEESLLVSWGIKDCSYDRYLDKLRLRIGDYEADEAIFDSLNNFFIPESYQDKEGEMFFRYKEPEESVSPECKNDKKIFENNDGNIRFSLTIAKDQSFISSLYDYFIVPIEKYITGDDSNEGIQKIFFNKVTGSDSLVARLLTICLTLYVIMTAVSYLFGLVKFSQAEFLFRILKAGIIIALVSPNSWNFFSEFLIGFFRDGATSLAVNIAQIADFNTSSIDRADNNIKLLFDNLDIILGMFISSDINVKILSLTFYPAFFGFLMVMMFYMAIYHYIHIIAQILVIYLAIFLMMTLLFILAPIFIIFALFSQTQQLFAKWLDSLIGYFIQYIFLAALIGIFSWIILASFTELMGYTVCWRPIFFCCKDMPTSFSLLEFFKPVAFDYGRFNLSVAQNYVPNFWDVAIFLFYVVFFRNFFTFAIDLATKIADGISVSGLASGISKQIGTNDMYKNVTNSLDKRFTQAGDLVAGVSRVGAAFYGGKGVKNPYRTIKEFMHKNKFLGVDRMFTDDEKKTDKVATIEQAVKRGKFEALRKGTKVEDEINAEVKSSLAKKGMNEKDIEKVLNSQQMKKESKLSSNQARELLTDFFDQKYMNELNSGKSAGQARKAATESIEKLKPNIGRLLARENASTTLDKKLGVTQSNKAHDNRRKKIAIMLKKLDYDLKRRDPKAEQSEGYLLGIDKNISKVINVGKQLYRKVDSWQERNLSNLRENTKEQMSRLNQFEQGNIDDILKADLNNLKKEQQQENPAPPAPETATEEAAARDAASRDAAAAEAATTDAAAREDASAAEAAARDAASREDASAAEAAAREAAKAEVTSADVGITGKKDDIPEAATVENTNKNSELSQMEVQRAAAKAYQATKENATNTEATKTEAATVENTNKNRQMTMLEALRKAADAHKEEEKKTELDKEEKDSD